VDRGTFEEDLAAELRPQVALLHPDASAGARETLLRATAAASARSVVARYSAARRRVLFAPENLRPQVRAAGLPEDAATVRGFTLLALAHEMVHAADDAAHGLGARMRAPPDAEALRALGMVAEGRAVHYAREAAAELGIAPGVAAVLPGGRGPPDERRARFHLAYGGGAAFVADLESRGGRDLAERALRDPPRRTSTVFHPRRYGPSGEEAAPDAAAALRAAGFGDAAAASELDLRARWIPRLGGEAVARAFRGFLAGAGVHRPDGGASVSLHEGPEDAAAYAAALRAIYGLGEREEEGEREGLRVCVLVRGPAVGSAVAPESSRARRDAERALDAVAGR
jgi:hypothetical protein